MSRTTQVMLSVLMLVMMTTKAWSQKTMVVLSDTHVMGPGLISHGDRFCFNLLTKGKKNRTF
jgi:hypothetical protein